MSHPDIDTEAAAAAAESLHEKEGGSTSFSDEGEEAFPAYTRYLVIAGSFVALALSAGLVHAWGVEMEYFVSSVYAGDDRSIGILGYVGTLMYFGMVFWGMPAGWAAEVWSYRGVCLVGTATMALGLLLASFWHRPWQLCVTHGLITCVGIGTVYVPAATAPARWFTQHRGLATGVAISGVGVGGLVIAPLTEYLMSNTTVAWCQRITAIYVLVLGSAASLLVRVPAPDRTRAFNTIDWRAFGSPRFGIHAATIFCVTAAYIVPFTYLPKFWVQHGLSTDSASVLITVANTGSSIGRLSAGIVADHLGVLNSLALALAAAGVWCLALWPFSTSFGSGVAMSLAYGISSGGYWTLAPLAAARLFGIERLTSNAGSFYTVAAAGAWLGNPVADAFLRGPSDDLTFLGMSVYVGALWVVASFMAGTNRWLLSRKLIDKV
ncbi:hypothetical protein H4R18_003038 [Coemansia javaensis]|uniref:MFS general substrate transporter n=1 Tax=Coemansia javaensis TaxID=2761396 RepID=A0A9W8HAC9_9FUNG|nr:hypothetical protein H4R18_003038 [Coemansia javaensis]